MTLPGSLEIGKRHIRGGHITPVIVVNDSGIPIKTIFPESVDVFVQDQTTPPFDLFFIQAIGIPTALTNVTAVDDLDIVVDSVANISVGNFLGVFSGVSGENRFYFGEVLGIAATTVTLDTPLDFAFDAGDPVLSATRDLNVDGSVTTQIFQVMGGGTGTLEVDVTRIMITMITDTAADLTTFGDIAGGLANGIVLRRVNADTRNIWNAKTNNDISNLAFDFDIFTATNPAQGVDGMKARYTFAGQDKHGVAVRLAVGEALELLIQDNLTSLDTFRMLASGHVVEN